MASRSIDNEGRMNTSQSFPSALEPGHPVGRVSSRYHPNRGESKGPGGWPLVPARDRMTDYKRVPAVNLVGREGPPVADSGLVFSDAELKFFRSAPRLGKGWSRQSGDNGRSGQRGGR